MNCEKIGTLILKLRKEQNFTQKQLADQLHVSDKAVSKWERGLGCPDISLLKGLAEVLGAEIKDLLEGELIHNQTDKGNLRNVSFYVCKECGNILTSTNPSTISCCGRTLLPLIVQESNKEHQLKIEKLDDYLYISADHPMTKSHAITFITLVTQESIWLHRLYPEQEAATSFPLMSRGGMLYAFCNNHGLWSQKR